MRNAAIRAKDLDSVAAADEGEVALVAAFLGTVEHDAVSGLEGVIRVGCITLVRRGIAILCADDLRRRNIQFWF